MKLLYCTSCHDIVKLLTHVPRYCACQGSSGHYSDDGLNALVFGPCEVIGIDNLSFVDAKLAHDAHPEGEQRRLITGARMGWQFNAFFIPRIGEEHHVRRD